VQVPLALGIHFRGTSVMFFPQKQYIHKLKSISKISVLIKGGVLNHTLLVID